MKYKKMYNDLVMANYFMFKYNVGFETQFIDFSDLEIPN